jgi:hypothetical protein
MERAPGHKPRTHATHPGLQLPEHDAVPTPGDDPNLPAGQMVQVPALAREYWPAGHMNAVALVDAATQAYPAGQDPEQPAVVCPDVAPKVPAGQAVQEPAPAREYVPAGQMDAVGDVDPEPQAYPAGHVPLHVATSMPATAP